MNVPTAAARLAASRDLVLDRIVTDVRDDPRIVAVWLTGSIGRGEADAFSDIDITVIVTEEAAPRLCVRPALVQAGTTAERHALITGYGELASVHENHHNAPPEGTFTSVIYVDPPLCIDWTLVPETHATRPATARLLFDTAAIPVAFTPSLNAADIAARLSERVAFFWLLAFPTARALLRGDAVKFQSLFESLTRTRLDIEAMLAGRPPEYRRDSVMSPLASDPQRCEALRNEATCMGALSDAIMVAGGSVPAEPSAVLNSLLAYFYSIGDADP